MEHAVCLTFFKSPDGQNEAESYSVADGSSLQQQRNPAEVVKAYTEDSVWRNRSSFLKGHEQIVDFLTKKWQKEKSYRLRKELVRHRFCPRTSPFKIILLSTHQLIVCLFRPFR